MPFGLTGAPATYARLMDITLKGLSSMAIPFLDDVLCHTKDLESHFEALRQVLEAHRKAGLRLQPAKCSFFQTQVEYLGHVVDKSGTRPMPSLVEMIRTWPTPTNRTEARVFVGKVSYYRRFIQGFAKIAKPLLDRLSSKNGKGDEAPFEPHPEITTCTNALKDAIAKAPILAHPRFKSSEPFILDTDFSASNRAIGACLSQKQDGVERPIAMAAKRLTNSQRSYSAFKGNDNEKSFITNSSYGLEDLLPGELAAVLHFCNVFSYYLLGRPFILRVDSRALKWLHTLESPSGMEERWLLTLSRFDFSIQHRLSHQHGNADGLSRAPHLPPADGSTLDVENSINAVQPPQSNEVWDETDWVQAQENDEDLLPIIRALRKGRKPELEEIRGYSATCQLYFSHYPDLVLNEHGVLCYNRTLRPEFSTDTKTLVAVVPRTWWVEAIRKSHEGAGHCGISNTLDRAARTLYFVGMGKVCLYVVRECEICQSKKPKPHDQRHTYKPVLSGYPFSKINIDYVGPLPTSPKGNRYILTVQDSFTRWLEAFPVRAATAENAVDKLTNEVFPRHGIPQSIHSDRGSHFTAHLSYNVAQILGIRITHTPSYNPKSNQVERAHRTLGEMLKSLCAGTPSKWETYLPQALFALRTQRSRVTQSTPFRMLFGREASFPLDMLFSVPVPKPDEYASYDDYSVALRNRIESAHAWARRHIGMAIDRQRRAYHQDRKDFLPGEKVWLYCPKRPPGVSSKFFTYWTGPWIVKRADNEVTYTILPDPSWQRKKPETVSIDRLKPYYMSERGTRMTPPDPDVDLRMVGDEFGEVIPATEEDDLEFVLPDRNNLPIIPEEDELIHEPQAPPVEPPPVEPPPAEPPPLVNPPPAGNPAGPATPGHRRAQRLLDEAQQVYGNLPEKRRRRTK